MTLAHLWTAAHRWSDGAAKQKGRGAAPIDLDRLAAHDLADLNLPADLRARIELRRMAWIAGCLTR